MFIRYMQQVLRNEGINQHRKHVHGDYKIEPLLTPRNYDLLISKPVHPFESEKNTSHNQEDFSPP